MEWVSQEEVREAYYECRKNKRGTRNQLKYEAGYEEECVRLCNELNNGTYQIGRSIAFAITKPKVREIFAADFRDRVVHHIVMRRLDDFMEAELITDTYNCRVGKGVIYGVERVREKIERISENYSKQCYILKCDISGFFMSIDKDILWRKLHWFIEEHYLRDDKEQLLSLVKQIVYHNPECNCFIKGDAELLASLPAHKSLFKNGKYKGLPIGNLPSQKFANFYLNSFDKWAVSKVGDGYGRYADDFVMISTDKKLLLQTLYEAREMMKSELGLVLHPDKVHIQEAKKGIKFTGSVIKQGRVYTGKRTAHNAEVVIDKYNKLAERGLRPNEVEMFVCTMNSYFGFMKHTKSYAIRRKIWSRVTSNLAKYCYISGRFEKVVAKKEFLPITKIRKMIIAERKGLADA